MVRVMAAPEEEARKLIDAQLEAAGWVIQDRSAMNRKASLGVAVREYPMASGPCDYLLFVDGKACGVVEAKPEGSTLSGVADQSLRYQHGAPDQLATWGTPLRFDYEASGSEIMFADRADPDPRSRRLFAFHKPETLLEWLKDGSSLRARLEQQHARCELLDPIPMPMVVQPCPWTTPFDGGYLDSPPGNAIVRHHTRPYLDELESIEMPRVYSAINAIQSTAWKINRPILETMRAVWAGGGTLGDLPPRDDDPLPARPDRFDEDESVRQEWKQWAAKVHAINARRKGKRYALMQKLLVAEKLADFPAIYFPHSMDWRGRVYPIPAGGPSSSQPECEWL